MEQQVPTFRRPGKAVKCAERLKSFKLSFDSSANTHFLVTHRIDSSSVGATPNIFLTSEFS